MNDVYRLIPLCIPRELHEIIYIYAGTCTPSSKNIKLYKEQIKHDIFPQATDTLWGALIGYKSPRYIIKNFNIKRLTNQELETKIALMQNRFETQCRYIKRCGEMYDHEREDITNKHDEQIAHLQKEQTYRLFYKYTMLKQNSSTEEI